MGIGDVYSKGNKYLNSIIHNTMYSLARSKDHVDRMLWPT